MIRCAASVRHTLKPLSSKGGSSLRRQQKQLGLISRRSKPVYQFVQILERYGVLEALSKSGNDRLTHLLQFGGMQKARILY
jgi:hypothetical protein